MERAINESYYEIFVKYVWRRDEFRSYISRRVSIMLQNGFVRAGGSPILKFCVFQNFHLLCPGTGDRQRLD